MLTALTVKPPPTPPEVRVRQLEREVHRYKSLCEHLGAKVFWENMEEDEKLTAILHAETQWFPRDCKDREYYYTGERWEEFKLVEVHT